MDPTVVFHERLSPANFFWRVVSLSLTWGKKKRRIHFTGDIRAAKIWRNFENKTYITYAFGKEFVKIMTMKGLVQTLKE